MKYEEHFPWGVDKDMTYVPTAEWEKIQARIAQLEAALRLVSQVVGFQNVDDDLNLVESLRMEASTCLLAAKAPGGGPLWRDGMGLLGKKFEAAADRIATLDSALRDILTLADLSDPVDAVHG